MQESSSTFPQWASSALYGIAWLLSCGTIAKLIVIWQHRHKPPAEARLIDAQATEIVTRSQIAVMDRLDVALETVDRLRAERDGWKAEYDEIFEQKAVLIRQNCHLVSENERLVNENNGYEKQVKRMNLTLQKHHLNYDDTKDLPIGPLE